MKRAYLAIIVGVIIIIGIIPLSFFERDADKDTVSPPPAKTEDTSATDTATLPAPPSETAAPVVSPPADTGVKPSFDIVRISPDGNIVAAGRAAPDATLRLFRGEQEIGTVTADEKGDWVFVPSERLRPGQHELVLRDEKDNASDPVMLVVPDRARGDETPPLAVAVPDIGPIRPLDATPSTERPALSIEVIHSDARGDVVVSGKGPKDGEIHLYIDDAYQGKVQVSSTGEWEEAVPTALDDRAVTVRADQVEPDGKVVSRAEVGFARESLDAPSAMERITVQPGHSLWRIARHTYGDGFDYVIIYRANQTQIRDPDLIYPGQVFMLPKRNDDT